MADEIETIAQGHKTFLERLRVFITKKEPLTKKLEVALKDCINGDRGTVVKAITRHDLIEDFLSYGFILLGLGISVILPLLLRFLI